MNWADAGRQELCYWNIPVITAELVLGSVTQPLWKSGMGISTKYLISWTPSTLGAALGKSPED